MSRVKLIIAILCLLGNVSFGQVSPKKLVKNYMKATDKFLGETDMSDVNLFMKGFISLGDIEGPTKAWVKESAMRMEFELMGVTFFNVNTDTLSWEYDPVGQKYNFTPASEGGSENSFTNDLDDKFRKLLKDGYEPDNVRKVKLDSLDAYELTVALDGDEHIFLFEPESYYLIGNKTDDLESYYLHYEIFENKLWPRTLIDINKSEGQTLIFRFDDYGYVESMDPGLFEFNDEARKAYKAFLVSGSEEQTGAAQKYYEQGVKLSNEGKHSQAIDVFNKGLAISPEDPVILNRRGLVKSAMGDYYGAIADYERAIEKRSDYSVAINNRGLAKYNLGDFDGALTDYNKALDGDSTNSAFLSNAGMVYMQKGDFGQMAAYFDEAIKYDSSSANYYYYRGMARAQIEEYEAALSDYERAEEMGAESPYLSNYKGVTLYSLGDFENALKAFVKAHELDSSHEQYLRNMADAQRELAQYQASIETYNKIIAMDSTSAYGYASRAISEYDLDQFEKALNDINKAISLYNENALYFDYRAYIKVDMKDFEGAIKDFTQSLEMEEDSHIYYKRGLAKIELKDDSGACEDFQKAADLEDENGKESLIKYCKN